MHIKNNWHQENPVSLIEYVIMYFVRQQYICNLHVLCQAILYKCSL